MRSDKCDDLHQPSVPEHNKKSRPALHLDMLGHGTTCHPQQRLLVQPDDMSCIEHNHRFNQQSGKVNSASCLSFVANDEPAPASAFASLEMPTDIDFSAFAISAIPPPPKSAVEDIVKRLLHPPPSAFVYGSLSIQWVIGVAGFEHFDFRESDVRLILRTSSTIRTQGRELGLPATYYEWLCGDEIERSSTDQGIFLVPDFFKRDV